MNKKTLTIMLAYVGIVTGAGLASGQELLQYFISLGIPGLIGIGIVGILHTIFGGILLELGSHYLADNHSDVFSNITNKYLSKFIDIAIILTCFIVGFVMIAGAGSNLKQAFDIPTWIGQVLCAGLIILVGFQDFKKVTKIIGSFTPVIIIFALIAGIYTLINYNPNWSELDTISKSLPSNINNVVLAIFNYYGVCLMTGVSMGLVLGGEELNPIQAGKGGLLGGAIAGLLGILISLTLFIRVDEVSNLDIPMLYVISDISPILGFFMAVLIFAMVFNTAMSLFYALARRFSKGDQKRLKIILVIITLAGFVLSFAGFKKLVADLYPIIGYVGMIVMVLLLVNWFKEKDDIEKDKGERKDIKHYISKKIDDDKEFTDKDQDKLKELLDNTPVNNDEIERIIKNELEK